MTPADKIDQLVAGITDWRGKTFASVRKAILEADKEIIEEWKWMGSPVWECCGIITVANAHKGKVKLTFDYGAKLPDPDKLFNAGLEGNQRRAIDFFEGDKVNAKALKISCVRRLNSTRARKRRRRCRPKWRRKQSEVRERKQARARIRRGSVSQPLSICAT